MPTSIGDIDKALYETVTGDKEIVAVLGGKKFFDHSPPQGTAVPYIHLGDPFEDKENVFNARGNNGSLRLHFYATSRKKAIIIYKHLVRLLDAQSLTLDDNVLIRGDLVLSVLMRDPEDPDITHGVAVFTYLTREASS